MTEVLPAISIQPFPTNPQPMNSGSITFATLPTPTPTPAPTPTPSPATTTTATASNKGMVDPGPAIKQVFKELKEINRKQLFDDEAEVSSDETNPLKLTITLTPHTGLYRGGTFVFSCTLSPEYPNKAPSVQCHTDIYHPNISVSGAVCLNIFKSDFSSQLKIEHYVNGLLFLLYNPNLDDRLNGNVTRDQNIFRNNARKAMKGISIDGRAFKACCPLDYDDREFFYVEEEETAYITLCDTILHTTFSS